MKAEKTHQASAMASKTSAELPKYEAPQVITYTDEEILEELGSAHTYGVTGSGVYRGIAFPW